METAYEAMYLIENGLADEQATAIVDKYTGVVTRGGGTVDDVDRWEPRRLAYEVKGRREGVYVVMNFRSEPAAKDELDRIFRISDDVLRHMVIKQDPAADRFPSQVRAAENERREREMAARAAAAPPPPPAAAETVTDLAAPASAPAENTTVGEDGVPMVNQTTSPAEEAPVTGIPNEAAAPDVPAVEDAAPAGDDAPVSGDGTADANS
jgi:small subunit ribosomal protein S6